ncbi:MAG: hypothetical protein Q8Q28_17570 [Pseudomonadota bacterium]|nr:hypothetical protein [Pseudomonadota bacterium]
MKNPYRFHLAAALCLALAATGAQAAEPLALRKVMCDLGSNMQQGRMG